MGPFGRVEATAAAANNESLEEEYARERNNQFMFDNNRHKYRPDRGKNWADLREKVA